MAKAHIAFGETNLAMERSTQTYQLFFIDKFDMTVLYVHHLTYDCTVCTSFNMTVLYVHHLMC